MKNIVLLGVDVGSTAVKAAVYAMDGTVLALESRRSAVIRRHPGWSEQDMSTVWATTADCIRTVVDRTRDYEVAAIGVCGQGDGLWLLDGDCQPVRNAILWNDSRADDLVLNWIADGTSAALSRYSRTSNWAGTAGSAFAWLKQHEPEAAARAAHLIYCKDWINFHLTGEIATDFSDASIPFMDIERRVYDAASFDLIGVGELDGKLAMPQPSTALHGRLLPEAARSLGLTAGLPVATGSIDLGAQMAAMRLNYAGDVGLILGTTAVVNVVVDPEPFHGEPVGATICHPLNHRWIRVVAPSSGALAVDWFTSLHQTSLGGDDASAVAGRLNELVSSVPAGANGVTFLPFLSGERAPFVAPHATGSFHGLTSASSKAEMARAVIEGVSFSLKHCFRTTGLANPGQVFMTGGGARNRLWCDVLASVLGTTIVVSSASDHGLWGVAAIGGQAAGLIDAANLPERPEDQRRHEPDPALAATYDRLFELYQSTVLASRPIWDAARQFRRTNSQI
ncbi:MAG: carbohydrate kinase [Ancalomicrobiaceae bacterium]|nr:carbohydrate kinase [Ancalomicrobiaceae bacterium]